MFFAIKLFISWIAPKSLMQFPKPNIFWKDPKMKHIIVIFVAMLMTMAVAQDKAMQDIELIRQIQNLTRDNSWTPGITSMCDQDLTKVCGLYEDIQNPPRNIEEAPENYVPRGAVDLRTQGKITPIKNQGQCGSCWAFAMTALVESVNGGKNLDLSEQHLVSCCTSSSGCQGGYIASVAQWIINKGGIHMEKDWAYTSGSNGQNGTCKTVTGTKYTISSVSNVSSNSAIKAALDAGLPVDTGMYVYGDFMYYKSGIYKHVSGDYKGGHAVVIVGYNDAESYWIVKNSWGTGWGENGYFRIAYSECNIPWMAAYVKK